MFLSLAQLCACVCHGCATFTTELKCLNSSLIAEFELKVANKRQSCGLNFNLKISN